jgi:RNA polymerase sigma-70 factor (ECF subfamily)
MQGDKGGLSMLTASRSAVERDQPAVAPLFTEPRRGHDDDRERTLTRRAVQRASGGDGEAMGELYDRYAARVYGHVRRMMRDRYDAEDITQLVFLKLTSTLDRYDERAGDFCPWLLRVARNLAIDELRRRRPMLVGDVFAPGAGPAGDEAAVMRVAAVRGALAELSDDQREVVVLRQVVGLRPREIADRMQRSEGSVHALYHRGRVAMQASLEDADSAPATRGSGRVAA